MTEKAEPPMPLATRLRSELEKPDRLAELVKVLPPEVRSEESAKRFISCAAQAITENPKFNSPAMIPSLALAVKKAASLGLEIGSSRDHCYLIPFKNEAKLMVGYKGYVHLAYRTGKVKTYRAGVIREGDDFEYDEGTDPFISHKRNIDSLDGEIVGFYGFIVTKDEGKLIEVMSRKQVEAVRDASQGYQLAKKMGWQTPWDDNFDEMGRKTVLRRLAKIAEFTWDLGLAVSIDEADDAPRQASGRVVEERETRPAFILPSPQKKTTRKKSK